MHASTPDPKPCPFCGEEAVTICNDNGLWIIGCHVDYMCIGNINHVTMIFVTQQQAIDAWNRRANDENG